MKGSKRYAYIPLAESTACEMAFERMEAAWESQDVELIGEALEGLGPYFIYSNYPWYKRWDELKPQVVRALWHGWPRARFWAIEGSKALYLWEFREALEPVTGEFSQDDLRQLCERCEFPVAHRQPQLWNRLVEEPGEEFSRWLVHHIETALDSTERLKAVQTHAPKTPFRIFHWQPFRPDVATPIEIVARRRDAVAHAKTRQWLRELPFANDRTSVTRLLSGTLANSYPELEDDFNAVLEKFSSPSNLRLLLFEWLAKLNLTASLVHFFADFRSPMSEEARETYIQFLGAQLPEWKSQQETLLQRELASVSYRGWSVFMRGYWASVIKENHLAIPQRVTLIARLVDKTVRLFDDTRPYIWGGCFMGLPMLLLVGFVIQIVLSFIWGVPSKQWMAFNWTITTMWAIYVAATATFDIYHGGEARRTRFKMALCSFGLLATMLILGIASRTL